MERSSILERERALRDQELHLALERERQTVRALVRERMIEQRERLMQDREQERQEARQTDGLAAPSSRGVSPGARGSNDLGSEAGGKELAVQEVRSAREEAAHSAEDGRRLHAAAREPAPPPRARGWASAADTEPEAEAEAGGASSAAAGELAEVALASRENVRLRQELEGLRQLAQRQHDEVGAAKALHAGAARGAEDASAPAPFGHANQAGQAGQAVGSRGQAWGAGCIPTVTSPGASPAHVVANQRQRAVQAGIDEYDRTVRAMMSHASDHHDGLASPYAEPHWPHAVHQPLSAYPPASAVTAGGAG